MHNCRSNFLAAMASWRTTIDKRDLSPNINFFLHAPVTPEGELTFAEGISEPGQIRGDAGGDGRDRAHQQLPAAQ